MTEKTEADSTAVEKLLALAAQRMAKSPEDILALTENPDWVNGPIGGDWCDYIPHEYCELWPILATETRLVLFIRAVSDSANDRRWE